MDRLEANNAIKKLWLQNWPALSTAIIGAPVAFSLDNVTKAEGTYFARLAIVGVGSEQRTLGGEGKRRFDRTAIIDVRISGPTNEGTDKLDRLALKVVKLFESKRIGIKAGQRGVQTFASNVTEPRRDSQSPQTWIVQIATPFEYTEVK